MYVYRWEHVHIFISTSQKPVAIMSKRLKFYDFD
jgi:hypothetical protein